MNDEERMRVFEILDGIISWLESFRDDIVNEINQRINVIKDLYNHIDRDFIEVKREVKESKEYFGVKEAKPRKPSGRKITQNQLRYLRTLYRLLGREPPKDIENWSFETADAMIDELKAQVTREGKWPSRKP